MPHQRLSIYIVTHEFYSGEFLARLKLIQPQTVTFDSMMKSGGSKASRGCEAFLPLQISFSWLHYAFKHFKKAIRHTHYITDGN